MATGLSAPLAICGAADGMAQDCELGAARYGVLHALRHGGVGHLQDVRAADFVEPGRQNAGKIPRSVGGEGELSWVRLFVGDQFGKIIGGHLGIGENQERVVRHHGHGDEILDRIVGQLLERVWIAHQRGGGREEQGIAVGRGMCGGRRADHVGAAGPVLDEDPLSQQCRQFVADQPADQVGCAAGGLRDDDLDRSRGPVLRLGLAKRRQHHGEQRSHPDRYGHVSLSCSGFPRMGPEFDQQ